MNYWLLFYLPWCISAWVAVVEFWRMPIFEEGRVGKEGLSVSWGECIVFAIGALIPIANIAMNAFWLGVFWRYWRKGKSSIGSTAINPRKVSR